LPSPPWGRGWPAAGVFTSRGGKGAPRFAGGGEGVTQEQIEKLAAYRGLGPQPHHAVTQPATYGYPIYENQL